MSTKFDLYVFNVLRSVHSWIL